MQLSRLTKVDLRSIWTSESSGFTPWLAQEENLALLGEAIDMDLELEAQEKDVGPFRADLLCKDTTTDAWVLVENQLERTDHVHLGQLLTYAAGLKAVTIVWIAQRFTEEHRAALDWLNDITNDNFTFFGLEVELWRIADSPVAPKFNVVSKPNDWTKNVTRGASQVEIEALTDTKRLQLEFWTTFHEHQSKNSRQVRPQKPQAHHWMFLAIGRTGFKLRATASLDRLRAELYLTGEDAKPHFTELESRKAEIERAIGKPLNWRNPSDKQSCHVGVSRSIDLRDREKWPDYSSWLSNELEDLFRVFNPIVRELSIEEPTE